MGLSDASDSRLELLRRWVTEDLGFADGRIEPASADASFRRYFRLTRDSDSFIVMDAPPAREDVRPFVRVARLMHDLGLNVPVVLASDVDRGLLLLTDLGSRLYLEDLDAGREVDRLYGDAMAALARLQSGGGHAARGLPAYDREYLVREMQLMPRWFLETHLRLDLSGQERQLLEETFDALAREAQAQPQTFVHRDYHSRNLLVCEPGSPGIIDFQDAMHGPVTYDLVSLLKDCYVAWPAERVRDWALGHRAALLEAGFALPGDARDFLRWFDLMGLQRHIKVLGIFARLYHRDGKPGYLKDLPRVLEYVGAAAAAHPQTHAFGEFVARRVAPQFALAQAREPAAAAP